MAKVRGRYKFGRTTSILEHLIHAYNCRHEAEAWNRCHSIIETVTSSVKETLTGLATRGL